LALSNDFTNPIQEKDLIQESTWGTSLLKGKEYYWRVATNGSNNAKLWSEVFKFTTKEDLQATTLIYPQDSAKDVKQPIRFTWHKSSGTASYKINISTYEAFDIIDHEKVGITDTVYSFDQLKKGTLYFWKIISVGPDTKAIESEKMSFTAGDTINSVYENIQFKSNLIEVSPNPVTDAFRIKCKFDAPNSIIEIVNSNGLTVANVFNGDIIYDVEFNYSNTISELSTGKYFVKISSNDIHYVYPFIIVK
jgi:hypothetical protein